MTCCCARPCVSCFPPPRQSAIQTRPQRAAHRENTPQPLAHATTCGLSLFMDCPLRRSNYTIPQTELFDLRGGQSPRFFPLIPLATRLLDLFLQVLFLIVDFDAVSRSMPMSIVVKRGRTNRCFSSRLPPGFSAAILAKASASSMEFMPKALLEDGPDPDGGAWS